MTEKNFRFLVFELVGSDILVTCQRGSVGSRQYPGGTVHLHSRGNGTFRGSLR